MSVAASGRAEVLVMMESTPLRALRGMLASFRMDLERERTDRSPLTERLRAWYRDFRGALEQRPDALEGMRTEYLARLQAVEVPPGPHRMLEPMIRLLQSHHLPIPPHLHRPGAAEEHAARLDQFRARQARYAVDTALRRALMGLLATLDEAMEGDPTDQTPLTEQLRIWHRGFMAALNQGHNLEETRTRYLLLLLNEIRVPEGAHRMLAPIAHFLQAQQLPIPAELQRPSPEQERAARIAALRGEQEVPPPAPVTVPAVDPAFVQRAHAVRDEVATLAAHVAVAEGRLRADADGAEQRLQQLNERDIPAVQQRVERVQAGQQVAGEDLNRARERVDALERNIEATKQELKDKQDNSFGGLAQGLVTLAVCLAATYVMPQLFAYGTNGGMGIGAKASFL